MSIFVQKKKKKANPITEFLEMVLGLMMLKTIKIIFSATVFPLWTITATKKTTYFATILGLYLHEKKELQLPDEQKSRHPGLDGKSTWTNPEFLTEAEKEKYSKKRIFFPEG